ncbi:MAG: hypothetical protein LC118_07890 [Dehalococcoidia bacterium]|nr:hypothetical protein [Dehalococcoidia bacterium]
MGVGLDGAVVGVGVGVAGRGVGVLASRVAVGPLVFVPATVLTAAGEAADVVVAAAGVTGDPASFPPASCAASTWFWLPSKSSSPAPFCPWSWLNSDGSRDSVLEPGAAGVATAPSAG